MRELLRNPDRNADRRQARCVGIPACVHRRLHLGRYRRCRRQPRDRAPASQPVAHEVEPARRRCGCAAADGRRVGPHRSGTECAGARRRRKRARDQEREGPSALRAHLRRRRLLEAHRRGVSESADRNRNRAVHPALAGGHGAARARSHRSARPPPRRARARVHGAQGVHPAGEVHLHRRPLGRTDLLGGAP